MKSKNPFQNFPGNPLINLIQVKNRRQKKEGCRLAQQPSRFFWFSIMQALR
jgi:hypothetical protein